MEAAVVAIDLFVDVLTHFAGKAEEVLLYCHEGPQKTGQKLDLADRDEMTVSSLSTSADYAGYKMVAVL